MMYRARLVLIVMTSLFCMSLYSDIWVGYPAPDFTVRDINGEEISLQKFRGKVVVLEWQDMESLFTKKFYSRLYYEGKGYIQTQEHKFTSPPYNFVWLTIDISPHPMSVEKWKEWLVQEGAMPTAVILDPKKELCKQYKVTKVPETFVLNAEGIVVYKGSIDSIRSSDPTDITKPANRRYLEMALQQIYEGKEVYTPDTIPYGSSLSD